MFDNYWKEPIFRMIQTVPEIERNCADKGRIAKMSNISREGSFFCFGLTSYPPFLQSASIAEDIWSSVVTDLFLYFESKYSGQNFSTLPRAIVTLLLEAVGGFRTGHLGPRRLSFETYMDQNFGSDHWNFEYLLEGRKVSHGDILKVYEGAYYNFFRANPKIVDWLTKNFSNVYDTAPSNVESGLDYQIQEAPELGHHIHDIAIRRALSALGKNFQGDRLLHVRGKHSEGYCLSPGRVPMPFHYKYKPLPRGWWAPNSLESWYQASRIVTVRGFNEEIIPASHWSTVPSLGVERVVARFLLTMMPHLINSASDNQVLTVPFWLLPPSSYPRDSQERPRAFDNSEIFHILEVFLPMYDFLVNALVTSRKVAFKKFNNRTKKIIANLRALQQNDEVNQSELFSKLVEQLPLISQREVANPESFSNSSIKFSEAMPEPWTSARQALQTTIRGLLEGGGLNFEPYDFDFRAFRFNLSYPLHSEELLAILLSNIYFYNLVFSEVDRDGKI